MKTNIFLAALPTYDNRLALTQKISVCEAKRSPLVRVQWTHTQDLHITLGFIAAVHQTDLRNIASGMSSISQTGPLMANVEEIKLYGNAIVLRLEPYQQFLAIHKKMNLKLMEITQSQYQFQVKGRFDPHLTIGRLRNVNALNPLHKHQFLTMLEEQFRGYSFLIQQAALLHRTSEHSISAYQSIQLYPLHG